VSRRHRGGAGPPRDAVARPSDAGSRLTRPPGALHLALVVIRNAVGVVGTLFLGWSAATLVVLYFADTVVGMWAVFAAVGFKLSNADPRQGFWASLDGALTGIVAGLVLAAVVAVPLGMPLIIFFGASGLSWQEIAADPALRTGIGVIASIGLLGAVRHVFALADGQAGDVLVKRTFAILMTRWVLVLMLIYLLVGFLGRFGLYVIVLAYAAASVWCELAPDRFAQLFPDRRPTGAS
jgi:hypothetical protein